MRIPYRPHTFTKVKKPYRYIIIHDTGKDIEKEAEIVLDTENYQVGKLRAQNMIINGEFDLNYHYIVEKIKDDYEVIVSRPLNAICEFDDIVAPYDASIHIAVMGDYDFDLPDERLYKVIAYRIIGPMLSLFKLDKSRVMLHSEVSTNKLVCPGENFEKDRLMSYTKSLILPR